MLWNQGMSQDLDREDRQVERKEEKAAQAENARAIKQLELEQRERESIRRSEDIRLTNEQRAEAARDATAARRELGILAASIAQSKADKPKDLKPLPAKQLNAWTENSKQIKFIDETLAEIEKYKGAFGLQNALPEAITQRRDPKGVNARARVSNIGSLKIHDRSGAAVSAMEFPRLRPFIPDVRFDDAATIDKKLRLFKREYELMQEEIIEAAETQGYRSPAKDTPAAPAPAQESKTINGKTYIKVNGEWYEK